MISALEISQMDQNVLSKLRAAKIFLNPVNPPCYYLYNHEELFVIYSRACLSSYLSAQAQSY